ncbi:MAG: heparinase II/III family protein [Syntrophothermus sp.]
MGTTKAGDIPVKVFNRLKREAKWWRARFIPLRLTTRELSRAIDSASGTIRLAPGRPGGKFFFEVQDRDALVRWIKQVYPETIPATIARADRICAHRFDLLGSGEVSLGEAIDWHCDFKTGYRWPLALHTEISFMDLQKHVPYDVKVPWELSRFQHLIVLGKAYWYTGDEKYAKEFATQVESWIEENPPGFGVNWACPMEAAIRAVNWIWADRFFAGSPSFSREARQRFLASLLLHGGFIARNLEDAPPRGNHFLADGVGLVYLALTFPGARQAAGWLKKGLKILLGELKNQVHPDGVDYEGSVAYHRLVTEFFFSAFLLGRANGLALPEAAWRKVEKMCEFIAGYTKPDGTAPQIGDNDDGRLHILCEDTRQNPTDHRYLLSLAAVVFRRPDFKEKAGAFSEEAFWLLGTKGLEEFQALPQTKSQTGSRGFSASGQYIMKHDTLYLYADCGELGMGGYGGHGHNDLLSFELYAYGRSLIVDPGTYVYTADPGSRNHFRGTAAHNTVFVDGTEMARLGEGEKLWTICNDTVPEVSRWEASERLDILSARHSGYMRLAEPVSHQRTIIFDKLAGYWMIIDEVEGQGFHRCEQIFHLAPMFVERDPDDTLSVRTTNEVGANLLVLPLLTRGLRLAIGTDWVSPGYGKRVRAPVIYYRQDGNTPIYFVTVLYPCPDGYGRSVGEVKALAQELLQEFLPKEVALGEAGLI